MRLQCVLHVLAGSFVGRHTCSTEKCREHGLRTSGPIAQPPLPRVIGVVEISQGETHYQLPEPVLGRLYLHSLSSEMKQINRRWLLLIVGTNGVKTTEPFDSVVDYLLYI